MSYYYSDHDGHESITIYAPGGHIGLATSDMAHFNSIKTAVEAKDYDKAFELIDLSKAVNSRFEEITDRVSVRDGVVYFDGDAIHNTLTEQIVRVYGEDTEEDGEKFEGLVNFMDKVMQNPNKHSREMLFDWLQVHDFAITPEGNFVGYKGVERSGDKLVSISSGKAFVDGVPQTGKIENRIGSVITMPRSEVQHDPAVGCHTGLHVGTWDYASSFGRGVVLEVEVDPRDVVSVPTDCGWQKLRTRRYLVRGELEAELSTAYRSYADSWIDDDYEDEDDWCNCTECREEREY